MIGQFLLALREALEAALIAAIIMAYLERANRNQLTRYVWYGITLAVASSFIFGALIWFVYGGLSGATKALFEGCAALFAVFVLSSMIYWMASKGKEFREEVEKRVDEIVTQGATLALASFSFVLVFREGLETVLFLTPFLLDDVPGTIAGALLGIMVAVVLAYSVFILGRKINIRKFFYFTSILLVLLAGGLAGYGTHELLEYAGETGTEIGWAAEYAYNLNIPLESPFHHKGIIGSVFAVMFGYTIKAEWLRLIVHLTYLAIALPSTIWAYKKGTIGNEPTEMRHEGEP